MLVGYMRVSKADGSQTVTLQLDALLAAGVDAAQLYEDHASGRTDDRPGLTSCLKALRKGDRLVVARWPPSALTRSGSRALDRRRPWSVQSSRAWVPFVSGGSVVCTRVRKTSSRRLRGANALTATPAVTSSRTACSGGTRSRSACTCLGPPLLASSTTVIVPIPARALSTCTARSESSTASTTRPSAETMSATVPAATTLPRCMTTT